MEWPKSAQLLVLSLWMLHTHTLTQASMNSAYNSVKIENIMTHTMIKWQLNERKLLLHKYYKLKKIEVKKMYV